LADEHRMTSAPKKNGLGAAAFTAIALAVAAALFGVLVAIGNDYLYFASYVVLQFVVLAVAWNILGGYCGYVNFGSAAFFAIGAYTTVCVYTLKNDYARTAAGAALGYISPAVLLPCLMLASGLVAGLVGLGMGYLTLRLRGVFFSIATLALSVVLQTLVVNWDFVGGSRGAYVIRPTEFPLPGGFVGYLFVLMLLLVVGAIVAARSIERSRLGFGFAAIRDDEVAAEAAGVPTLRLKLIATTLSGALMGMAGAPFPYYIGYLEPASAFGLAYGVNAIAMPMVGGTHSWVGPLVGALILGTFQQVATVTISSVLNLLIVGLILIVFVIVAPNGITGLFRDLRHKRAQARETKS
jgi:branched-chain amino acid transport system permease protein